KKKKLIGKILVEMKAINDKQLSEMLEYQKQNPGQKIGEILLENKLIDEKQLTGALAKQSGLKFVSISRGTIPDNVIETVPKNVAVENKIIPVKKKGRKLTIASNAPLDIFTLDNLKFILNAELECVLVTKEEIMQGLTKYYGSAIKDMSVILGHMDEGDVAVREEGDTEEKVEDDAPIIRLVTHIISEAVKMQASDIHVEPMTDKLRIRYRVDGVCTEMESPPKRLQSSILSRLKLMAGMNIAEKRVPQDGRIPLKVAGKELDIRVAALPATHGESIVMRLLEKEALVTLEELGFHESDHQRFQTIIKKPNGIFLVTGPTGSGKTTTLSAALKELNKPNVKIITAENPVEYILPGVNQCHVRTEIGFTFSTIIRAMLRQAPQIILIGEIRDMETAEAATQAALTGHLVFSTLHTNDAPSAITRLLDMNVKPFLVAASIQAIMAQRLVRMLCPKCKEEYEPDDFELAAIGVERKDIKGHSIYKPVGCKDCGNKGYKGRKGIFELMEMNSTIRELTFNKEPTLKIAEQARIGGMTTLIEDGIRKIMAGTTSIEEIIKITHRQDLTY
ncbi:MAG: Flp pilus assembly complex ATPase component TadA, partial [Planctomycetes bacterium]|nr:Flp pilus assembly complex ATPase component TadA [Planctomycetota bacterium]